MSTIKLAQKDIQLVRQLRNCLTNKTVNIDLLENLLTSLEGKLEKPSTGERKKRTVHKHSRVAKYMVNIAGGIVRRAS